VRTAFENAVKRAGILHYRFHDLPHTVAFHIVMCGRSLQEVKEVLGHSDYQMTLRFAHLSPAHLQSAAAALDQLTPMPSDGHTAPLDDELVQERTQNTNTKQSQTLTA